MSKQSVLHPQKIRSPAVMLLVFALLWSAIAVAWHTRDHDSDVGPHEHCQICFYAAHGSAPIPALAIQLPAFSPPLTIASLLDARIPDSPLLIHRARAPPCTS